MHLKCLFLVYWELLLWSLLKQSFAESSSRSIPVACLSLCLCRWDFELSLTLFLQEEWLCPIFCFPCCFNWHDSSALMGSSPFLASVSVHKSKWLLVKSMDNVGVTPVFVLSSIIMLWWSVCRFLCKNHTVKKKNRCCDGALTIWTHLWKMQEKKQRYRSLAFDLLVANWLVHLHKTSLLQPVSVVAAEKWAGFGDHW